MKDIFEVMSEARIREAIARGEFENLPGSGKAIKLEDLSFLPPELRAAYLLLKNSGYLEEPSTSIKPALLEDEQSPLPKITSSSSDCNMINKTLRYNVTMDSRRRR